jgi:hypothetical protein
MEAIFISVTSLLPPSHMVQKSRRGAITADSRAVGVLGTQPAILAELLTPACRARERAGGFRCILGAFRCSPRGQSGEPTAGCPLDEGDDLSARH